MLEGYTKEVEKLLDWYTKTKELAIKVEGLDSKAYIQPLHELRYSYDHLMRAIAYDLGADDEGRVGKAIDAAKGHLIRSYSDCIEWLLVTVKEEYSRILQPIDFTDICKIMPEYPEIKKEFDTLSDYIDAYKSNKKSEDSESFNPIDEINNPLITQLSGEDGFLDGKYADFLIAKYKKIKSLEGEFSAVKRKKTCRWFVQSILIPAISIAIAIIVPILTKFL